MTEETPAPEQAPPPPAKAQAQPSPPAPQEPTAPPPPPGQLWLQDKFQSPVFTGIAASVILALMRLTGMMPLMWFIIVLPGLVAVVIWAAQRGKRRS
jgi:hypothetical protein